MNDCNLTPRRTGIRSLAAGGAVLASAFALASASVGAAQAHPDYSGVWETEFKEFVYTDEGKVPPMQPAALAAYTLRVGKERAGEMVPDTVASCLPHGTPRVMYTPYPMRIMQQHDVIGMLFEANHLIRIVYMDEKLPVDPDPTYMGYSVGHWEGPILVIETAGLNNKILVDRAGLPESEHTRITERLSLVDGGKRVEDKITLTDETLYTAPWSFTVRYKKTDSKLMEFVCDNMRPD
jgi:hypothetical protein